MMQNAAKILQTFKKKHDAAVFATNLTHFTPLTLVPLFWAKLPLRGAENDQHARFQGSLMSITLNSANL